MEKKPIYSFASFTKVVEGKAVGVVQAFTTKDIEVKEYQGKEIAKTSIAPKRISSKLKYALGHENIPVTGDEETTFINLTGWKQVATRMEKILRKGTLITVYGTFSVNEYNGNTYVECNVQDFKVDLFPKDGERPAQNTSNPFPVDGRAVDVEDDDLPF